VPLVGTEAQFGIGVECVEPGVLIAVGAQLGGDAGAAALLIEIEQHPAPGLVNRLQAAPKLFAAVASQGAEQIAGDAGGMDADRRRLVRPNGSDKNRHLVPLRQAAAEHDELGAADILQRHMGAGHDFESSAGARLRLQDILLPNFNALGEFIGSGARSGQDDGGKQKREPGKPRRQRRLHGSRTPCGRRLLPRQIGEAAGAFVRETLQRDEAAGRRVQPKSPRSVGRQEELMRSIDRAAESFEDAGGRGVQRKRGNVAGGSADDNRPAGAQFGHGPLSTNRAAMTESAQLPHLHAHSRAPSFTFPDSYRIGAPVTMTQITVR
jgi:hypothetical protein